MQETISLPGKTLSGLTLLPGNLIVVFKIIFPLIMTMFGRLEIFFVNGLGLPFHSGTIAAFIDGCNLLLHHQICQKNKRNCIRPLHYL
jgi:hypothetical protein